MKDAINETVTMSREMWAEIRRRSYRHATGQDPIELTNPFTGKVFWIQRHQPEDRIRSLEHPANF